MKSKYPVIALDYDGTICAIRCGWEEKLRQFFYTKIQPDKQDPLKMTAIENFIAGCSGTTVSYQMQFLRRCIVEQKQSEIAKGLVDLPSLQDLLNEYNAYIAGWLDEKIASVDDMDSLLIQDARVLLSELQSLGYVIYLVSGSPKKFVEREVEMFELRQYFKTIIASDEFSSERFKEIAFAQIAKEEAITHDQLLVIGDGPSEIMAAQELGCPCLGVAINERARKGACEQKYSRLEHCECKDIVSDLQDVLGFLEK